MIHLICITFLTKFSPAFPGPQFVIKMISSKKRYRVMHNNLNIKNKAFKA